MNPICHVYDLGRINYLKSWDIQEKLAELIAAGKHPPSLLLLEHPHTFTFGRRGKAKNLLWDEHELKKRGIEVYWVDRGGDITYHGPGQLVGYPLLQLGTIKPQRNENSLYDKQLDVVSYLRKLELTIITALARLGIEGFQIEGITGVWVNHPSLDAVADKSPRKIASIGVKIDALGLTHHGFALNVNPDMTYWQGIIPCGLDGYTTSSMAELLANVPDMDLVSQTIIAAFGKVFKYKMVEQEDQRFVESLKNDLVSEL